MSMGDSSPYSVVALVQHHMDPAKENESQELQHLAWVCSVYDCGEFSRDTRVLQNQTPAVQLESPFVQIPDTTKPFSPSSPLLFTFINVYTAQGISPQSEAIQKRSVPPYSEQFCCPCRCVPSYPTYSGTISLDSRRRCFL
jgi:hypothetical protein